MNNNFWTKTTHWRLFGKLPLFTKEEICSDVEYQGEIYNIQIKKEYYDQEFNTKNKKDEK